MMKLPPHYTFKDVALGQLALTHRSYAVHNNERLEWLGDAVLELEISRLLYHRFPKMAEGGLSQLRTALVQGRTLAKIAHKLALGEYAQLGAAGMHAGRENSKLLANLMESYLAAIYLDGGDVAMLLQQWFDEEITTLATLMKKHGTLSLRDAKTQLQEYLQKHRRDLPTYTLTHKQGKDGNALFTVECRVSTQTYASARATTIAKAEAQAAALCLRTLLDTEQQPTKRISKKPATKKINATKAASTAKTAARKGTG